MRRKNEADDNIRIMVCDDEQGIIDSLKVVFSRSGYYVEGETDPLVLIERLKEEHFDILILDYLFEGIHGDEIVNRIREFSRIYIVLLTGHKDLVPPLETLRKLYIQDYCEKSDRFDQIILRIESAVKALELFNDINDQGFKERLKMLRTMHGLSQDDLSIKTDISRSTISELEKGKYLPNSAILIKLSKFFKVSVDYMLNVNFEG